MVLFLPVHRFIDFKKAILQALITAKRPQVLTGCHTTVNNNSHPVTDLLHQTENVR